MTFMRDCSQRYPQPDRRADWAARRQRPRLRRPSRAPGVARPSGLHLAAWLGHVAAARQGPDQGADEAAEAAAGAGGEGEGAAGRPARGGADDEAVSGGALQVLVYGTSVVAYRTPGCAEDELPDRPVQ